MHRCLELARKGGGKVSPNPMVGAVLVHQDRIIGEGWHREYGGPHAEVNCLNQAIQNGHELLFEGSELYVSLEPCAHFGKTPPCADLIIRHRIPKVVIGTRDPFEKVNGRGIDKLRAAGITVEYGILEKECRELNKRFFMFQTQNRPYLVLKWAQTADGFIAGKPGEERLLISNEFTNRLVHQWRAEEDCILVGTGTALSDNPALTNRYRPGHSPVRLVLDRDRKLPQTLKLFDGKVKTIVFNRDHEGDKGNLCFRKLSFDRDIIPQLPEAIHKMGYLSVLVEGGARLLQSLIDAGAWDEIRIIENQSLKIGQGVPAPRFSGAEKISKQVIMNDHIEIFRKQRDDQ